MQTNSMYCSWYVPLQHTTVTAFESDDCDGVGATTLAHMGKDESYLAIVSWLIDVVVVVVAELCVAGIRTASWALWRWP
jgi:hypothetical protein